MSELQTDHEFRADLAALYAMAATLFVQAPAAGYQPTPPDWGNEPQQ